MGATLKTMLSGRMLGLDTKLPGGQVLTPAQATLLTSNEPQLEAVLKIFQTWTQLLALCANIELNWPAAIYGWLSFAQATTSAICSWVSMDCSLVTESYLPRAVQRQVVTVLMPVFFFALLTTLWGLRFCWLAGVRQKIVWSFPAFSIYMTRRLIISALATIYTLYPQVVNAILSTFQCLPVDPPFPDSVSSPFIEGLDGSDLFIPLARDASGPFWTLDPSLRCYEGVHRALLSGLGIGGVIIFALGVPFTFFFIMFHNRALLFTDKEFAATFGFLYREYVRPLYFWESVVLVQKLAFAAVVVSSVILNNPSLQVLLALCVIEIMLIMQLAFRPYRHQRIDHLNRNMLVTLTATLYLLLWLTQPDLSSSGLLGIIALVVTINCLFGINALWCMWVEIYKAAWVIAARDPEADREGQLVKLLARRLGTKLAVFMVKASEAKSKLDRVVSRRISGTWVLASPRMASARSMFRALSGRQGSIPGAGLGNRRLGHPTGASNSLSGGITTTGGSSSLSGGMNTIGSSGSLSGGIHTTSSGNVLPDVAHANVVRSASGALPEAVRGTGAAGGAAGSV